MVGTLVLSYEWLDAPRRKWVVSRLNDLSRCLAGDGFVFTDASVKYLGDVLTGMRLPVKQGMEY